MGKVNCYVNNWGRINTHVYLLRKTLWQDGDDSDDEEEEDDDDDDGWSSG
jgi:hypothetical protein